MHRLRGENLGLTREKVRELTDSRSYERGVRYFENGRVGGLIHDRGTVAAKVEGTRIYRVAVSAEEDRLQAECTCPMGDRGVFCKHCVAVCLACIECGIEELDAASAPQERQVVAQGDSRVPRLDNVRSYLMQQGTEALVEIIIRQAMQDDALLRRLTLEAAQHRAVGVDTAAFRQAIEQATSAWDYVDYGSVGAFAGGIDDVVESLARLVEGGHAPEAIELAEYAIKRVEGAMGYVDDSDGQLGGVLRDLEELHHAACVAGKPAPVELARRLFQWEMTSDWTPSTAQRKRMLKCWAKRVSQHTASWRRQSGKKRRRSGRASTGSPTGGIASG